MTYKARSARDAAERGYVRYADYLEEHALELRTYFLLRGQTDKAEQMMTRTLSEALQGNDGD